MTSREDDDTLPLPGLSQLCADNTVDEDIIPTSQPQSSNCSKTSKKSDLSFNEEKTACTIPASQISFDSTVPVDQIVDQSFDRDKSSDFIPETDTKKRKIEYSKEELSCRKKLPVNEDFTRCTEDIFDCQLDVDVSKIPESPVVGTQNVLIVNESPPNEQRETKDVFLGVESGKKSEESITEVLVDESAETVDLEACENSLSKVTKSEVEQENPEKIGSFVSDIERCEETQIFDNSIMLLDQPEVVTLDADTQKQASTQNSERLYLQETLEDNYQTCESQNRVNNTASMCSLPKVAQMEETSAMELTCEGNASATNGEVNGEEEVSLNKSDSYLKMSEISSPSVITEKMEYVLKVSCRVTFNAKTKKVLEKVIANVSELSSSKTKQKSEERLSENASDKSKRYSSSSAGSVYSDKIGLPFNLSKRGSTMSNLTDASDSADEGLIKIVNEVKKLRDCIPWTNEHLFPLKMDELLVTSLENQDWLYKTPEHFSPRKPKKTSSNGFSNLDEKLECSLSERTSSSNLNGEISHESETVFKSEEERVELGSEVPKNEDIKKELIVKEKIETPKKSESKVEEKHVEQVENMEDPENSKTKEEPKTVVVEEPKNATEEEPKETLAEEEPEINKPEEEPKITTTEEEPKSSTNEVAEEVENSEKVVEPNQDEDTSAQLSEDLPVFARWTDKRYYSGVLIGALKNDRWNMKFDDGTVKSIKEDSLIPTKWLKAGELVFALVDDKYESGQIVKLIPGKETTYVVELDEKKRQIEVTVSDLCLSEVMASIVKEKYRPFASTPSSKSSCNIDFDNVLSGKRHREHRTPLRYTTGMQAESSGAKKKVTSKSKPTEQQEDSTKKTPQKRSSSKETSKTLTALQAEDGHLVEDKVISTESPSGNETSETPLRSVNRESKRKPKPKSLSYETVEATKAKLSDWVAPDGTPIPGPSGIKVKRRTPKSASLNAKFEIIKTTKLPSVEEENATPVRSSRRLEMNSEEKKSSLKKGKQAKKSPEAESRVRSTGKRKLIVEEPGEVQTKTVKRDTQRKKGRSRN